MGDVGWASISEGQCWRSLSDGRELTIVGRAHASGWLTHLDGNDGVLITVEEMHLLDFYELVSQGLDLM